MNTPVTHAECLKKMEELELKLHTCIKEEQVDFKEALGEVREWVGKLESKMDYVVFGLLFLALEGLVSLVMLILDGRA